MRSRLIHSYSLDSGAGTQTLLSNLDPLDLSTCESLTLVARLTKTDTDTVDTCSIGLQCTFDTAATVLVWDDRARLTNFTGDQSASVTTPEELEATVHQSGFLDTTEEAHEATGSLGGSRLTGGTVRNGPFPGVRRTSAGRQTSWRLEIVVTDADADADFEGVVEVWGASTLA